MTSLLVADRLIHEEGDDDDAGDKKKRTLIYDHGGEEEEQARLSASWKRMQMGAGPPSFTCNRTSGCVCVLVCMCHSLQ